MGLLELRILYGSVPSVNLCIFTLSFFLFFFFASFLIWMPLLVYPKLSFSPSDSCLIAALCKCHQLAPGDPHSRQIFKCNPGSEYPVSIK